AVQSGRQICLLQRRLSRLLHQRRPPSRFLGGQGGPWSSTLEYLLVFAPQPAASAIPESSRRRRFHSSGRRHSGFLRPRDLSTGSGNRGFHTSPVWTLPLSRSSTPRRTEHGGLG